MITILKTGTYKLIETHKNTKVLYLDDAVYAWIDAKKIGEVLVTSHKQHRSRTVLSTGNYILYDVEDEPYLTDLQHLELEYGLHVWQGYLLTSGLPDDTRKRTRIIPTNERITGISYFSNKMRLRQWHTANEPTTKKRLVGGRT